MMYEPLIIYELLMIYKLLMMYGMLNKELSLVGVLDSRLFNSFVLYLQHLHQSCILLDIEGAMTNSLLTTS